MRDDAPYPCGLSQKMPMAIAEAKWYSVVLEELLTF